MVDWTVVYSVDATGGYLVGAMGERMAVVKVVLLALMWEHKKETIQVGQMVTMLEMMKGY